MLCCDVPLVDLSGREAPMHECLSAMAWCGLVARMSAVAHLSSHKEPLWNVFNSSSNLDLNNNGRKKRLGDTSAEETAYDIIAMVTTIEGEEITVFDGRCTSPSQSS